MKSAARAVGGLRQDPAFIPEEEHLSVDPEVGVFGAATVNMDFFKGDESKFRNIFQKKLLSLWHLNAACLMAIHRIFLGLGGNIFAVAGQ